MNTGRIRWGQVIGMRLKSAREGLGLSPEEVAKHFGVTCRTVLNWEMGRAIRMYAESIRPSDPALADEITRWLNPS